eukprot:SAG22_NODE_3118_length_1925_cov_1.474261_2_plen_76_part_01
MSKARAWRTYGAPGLADGRGPGGQVEFLIENLCAAPLHETNRCHPNRLSNGSGQFMANELPLLLVWASWLPPPPPP